MWRSILGTLQGNIMLLYNYSVWRFRDARHDKRMAKHLESYPGELLDAVSHDTDMPDSVRVLAKRESVSRFAQYFHEALNGQED